MAFYFAFIWYLTTRFSLISKIFLIFFVLLQICSLLIDVKLDWIIRRHIEEKIAFTHNLLNRSSQLVRHVRVHKFLLFNIPLVKVSSKRFIKAWSSYSWNFPTLIKVGSALKCTRKRSLTVLSRDLICPWRILLSYWVYGIIKL